MKFLLLIIFCFIMTSEILAEDLLYQLISTQKTGNIKIELDIRAEKKFTEKELKENAAVIYKAFQGSKYPRMFICWYLPGMKVDSGAWATTHFNPALEVEIMDWMLEHNPTNLKNGLNNH